ARGVRRRQCRDHRRPRAHQELPRLRHLPARADRGHPRAHRPAELRRGDLRGLPQAARRPVRGPRAHRLAGAEAEGHDVRLGRDPRRVQGDGLARVLEAPAPRGEGCGVARHRLRRVRRPLRALRAHRERAPHAPGRARHPAGARGRPRPEAAARRHGLTRRPPGVGAPVRVGLIGFGTIGTGVLKLLRAHRADITRRAGRPIEIVAIADLDLEASVGGGIPILRTLKEGLAGDRTAAVYGIVNGTCNHILTTMTREGRSFGDVLAEAQRLGLAEADPSTDVDGIDSAHKLALLTTLAFNVAPRFADIPTEGIRRIEPADIAFARELGYTIKLLAIAKDGR